jgi:DNA-binding CsgD family transcriptional regulator
MRYDLETSSAEFVRLCVLLYDNAGLGLTKREAEIVTMMLYQWPISKIASCLSREEKTIHKHLQNIKKKMSCPTLFGLGAKISGHLSQLQQNS